MFCCCSKNNFEERIPVIAWYDEIGNPYTTKKKKQGKDICLTSSMLPLRSQWSINGQKCKCSEQVSL